jgi:release factor glutamine methyltransferase
VEQQAVQQALVAAGLDPAPREGAVLVEVAGGDTLKLQALLARRLNGEPLAYVVGFQPFWSRDWHVTPAVLIPRPDSEVLVHAVLERLPSQQAFQVAEVGVGSGALLGSVLLERPRVQGLGTELMPAALAIAQQNLQEVGVLPRVQLIQADVLMGVAGEFDVIFSNPPYISAQDYAALESGVRGWEPPMALLGGVQGDEFYHGLAHQAWQHVRPGGWLCVEIGHTQGASVQGIFTRQGFAHVEVKPDLAQRDRVVLGQKPGS